MIVRKIRVKKFKSIYDELTIDFNEVRGFWKIAGPVGVGKTTIGEAIIFGLFGTVTGKTNESLISWGEKHSLVETWCTCRGHDVYIKREINKYGQSPMYVMIDGEELLFTNKRDGQQQLETEYYDVSRTALELLCIISFNNFKNLATLNANDTKKFLDQVLGFSILSDYYEACRELRKIPYQEYLKLLKQIDSNNDQIKKIDELSNIARIDGDIEIVNNNIKKYEKQRREELSLFDAQLKDLRKRTTDLQSQLSKIKTLGVNKKKEIDFIKKGTCPTCGAPIDQSQLSVKEQEREVLISQYKSVSEQISTIHEELSDVEEEREQKDHEYRQIIQSEHTLLTKLKEQEKRSSINKEEISKLHEINESLQKQTEQLSVEDEQWAELQNILSDEIRAKILASFIPTLNKNIAKYNQELHQPYVIEFDHNFKCNIFIYGINEAIPISNLSTGQLKIADMCIMLGVLNTIMSNISFNISFLDELVSNMDHDLRNMVCQVLKQNLKRDQTLFIISHVDLDDRYFDGQIDLRMQYIDDARRKTICEIIESNYNQSY